MRERVIEAKLRRAVEAAGGRCLKWVSPGAQGVPDRVLLFPGGKIAFVEVKRPGGKLSALQADWLERLRGLGFEAACVENATQVEELVARLVAGATGAGAGIARN